MEKNERSVRPQAPTGYVMAPIHAFHEGTPLRICLLVRSESQPSPNPFVLLRELPGSRVYLGVVSDAAGQIREWVEVWTQALELRDLAFSGYEQRLSNHAFDQRWRSEWASFTKGLPQRVIATGMEEKNPAPLLVKPASAGQADAAWATVEAAKWSLCKDDALLESLGLPPYSTSPFRYLHEPDATGAKSFVATAADAPVNAHAQHLEKLSTGTGAAVLFNPHAGLIGVAPFSPLELEDYLQILEGRPWSGPVAGAIRLFPTEAYAGLQAWSENPKGLPFLLHGAGTPSDRLNEIFFLKLSALLDMFKEVRSYVKAQQLPLLNLTPSSFRVSLPETGDQFPAFWAVRCALVKPGQAYPLKIRSTQQKYFIRLGQISPSPFLPEGLGAHSFGIGSVRLRKVTTENDGVVLEGTLVAEDYLGVDPHDLLWFKLPLGAERLEFFAHVYTAEAVGPKEARFRTVPSKLAEAVSAPLARAAGTVFAKSPYEIWPLLSSPCDMYSLGVMAVRILLANSSSNFPVVLDEVLGLSRHLGDETKEESDFLSSLKSLLGRDPHLLDLVSPHALTESAGAPPEARQRVQMDIWLETIGLVLRLFPGAGAHSFCKDLGDVSPLALETVFDRPRQEIETLVLRLRSILVPALSANEEIANVILDHLAAT